MGAMERSALTMRRKVAATAALAAALLWCAGAADAYQTTAGWVASDYATGFAHRDMAGPLGLAFDGSGNLLVTNSPEGSLYKIAPGGGTAAGAKIRDGYGEAEGLAFDKSGRLYLARGFNHDVVELDPSDGRIIRQVVTGLPCPTGLATDPISGDLFVSNVFCPGGGIMRITNFAAGPGTAGLYAGGQDADGLAFAPDGTLYASAQDKVVQIAGTSSGSPGAASDVAGVPFLDGIAVAPPTPQDNGYLVVSRTTGEIDRVGFDGRVTPVLTGGSRADLLTVGPDRCIYADLQDRVIKLGPSTGSCLFAAPVQPGFLGGADTGGKGLGDKTASRVVDTAVAATAPRTVSRTRRLTLTVKSMDISTVAARGVVVTDTLPPGVRFEGVRAARGVRCSRTRGTVVCRKSSLAPRTSFTVRLVVRVLRGSRYTNRVRIGSHDLDPVPGNNRSQSKTIVRRSH
jgi:hypothetical protein